jgi:hypothetical protein
LLNFSMLSISLIIGEVRGEVSSAFSADGPTLFQINPNNVASENPAAIFVQGRYFGRSTQSFTMRIAGTYCPSTTWISDTTLTVRNAGGIALFSDLVVTIQAHHLTSMTGMMSFDQPSWKSSQRVNVPTRGDVLLTVKGLNFGMQHWTQSQSVGKTACESSMWISDSTVVCSPSSGVHNSWQLSVTLGRQHARISQAISYDVSSIDSLRRSNLGPQPSSEEHMILGSNFGRHDTTIVARICQTTCPSTSWWSATTVSCKSSTGVGGFLAISLTMARVKATSTISFSFDVASPILMASATNLLIKGGHWEKGSSEILASNIGPAVAHSLQIRLGQTACGASTWKSDVSVLCKSSAGLLSAMHVILCL